MKGTTEKVCIYAASLVGALFLALFTLYLSPHDPTRGPVGSGNTPGRVEKLPTGWAKVELVLGRVANGESHIHNRQPVWNVIRDRLPTTLKFTVPGILLGAVLGFVLGSAAGRWMHAPHGKFILGAALTGVIVPSPVWVEATRVGWNDAIHPVLAGFGVTGAMSDSLAAVVTLALLSCPVITVHQASVVMRAIHQPDVLFAQSLGLSTVTVWRWMVLPRSWPYWKTQLSLLCVSLFEGSLLIEQAFDRKGIGLSSYDAVSCSDAALVVLLVGTTCSLVNLGVLASGAAVAPDAGGATQSAAPANA